MRWCLICLCLLSRVAFGANYFIDPAKGNDGNSGKLKTTAWKTFARVNQITFKAGDHLFIFPGKFDTSLQLSAQGTAVNPVIISFMPGVYNFYDTNAYRAKLAISNTNDVPDGLKTVAILIRNSKYVKLEGHNAKLVMHAKMIETCVGHSQNVSISGLSYDYAVPTVSEFTVTSLTDHTADLKVQADSRYSIKDSSLYWEGEGWQYKSSWYWQEFNPANSFVTRTGLSFDRSKFETIENGIRVHFPKNPGLKQSFVYQTRDVTRDCAGFFLQRSKNIAFKNVRIYFMHGMGIVSQFCENVSMDGITVKPGEGRTCAAWADILHFSGCKGLIDIRNCYLSAANDDAINVHGVHLRIVGQPAANQLKLRFMHNQTYGFQPYLPGDSIELVHGNSLLTFGSNVVEASTMLNDREVLITLKKPVNGDFAKDDAVENISWTPTVRVTNTTITSIPTRGILVTTRRPSLIQHNRFLNLAGAGVLVADDAESWYESGPVKNLRIINNDFITCGEPAIDIHPENTAFDGPVHQNILVRDNRFVPKGSTLLAAKSTKGLKVTHNTIKMSAGNDTSRLYRFEHCSDVKTDGNIINP